MERLPEFDQLDLSMLTVSDGELVAFLNAARKEPGVTVTAAARQGEKYVIHGWWDRLATNPTELMVVAGLEPDQVIQSWEHYHAADPQLALRRLRKHVEFPPTITSVQVHEKTGKLFLRGAATLVWLQKLQYTMNVLDIENMIDISKVAIIDASR